MGLRSVFARMRDSRNGDTTDPLGLLDEPMVENARESPEPIYMHDLAPVAPPDDESGPVDVDAALDQIEDNGDWLNDLYEAKMGDDDEDTPPPTLESLAPSVLEYVPPAGAVHNRQNVYEGGRRCAVPGCGVPCVADVCSRCAMGGNDDAA